MNGLVLKKNAGLFDVECEGKVYTLKASGNVKKQGLYVGDRVEFGSSITKILPRKNKLIRPPLCNLDKLFIVVAPVPKPDFVLVDKLILYARVNNIEPIIVINKSDIISKETAEEIRNIYTCFEVFVTSVHDSESEIIPHIKGICALAGQSAVGKSSLINLITKQNVEVGQLSKKVERGKQTTRVTCLYKVGGGYLADTAGFSLLDAALVLPIEPAELGRYYPEFLQYIPNCKYRTCLHEGGQCGIIEAVKAGKINHTRYQNYLKILQELKTRRLP